MDKRSTFSKMSEKQQVFSIRKFNVGVASVAIAAFWLVSGGQVATADELVSPETVSDQSVLVEEGPLEEEGEESAPVLEEVTGNLTDQAIAEQPLEEVSEVFVEEVSEELVEEETQPNLVEDVTEDDSSEDSSALSKEEEGKETEEVEVDEVSQEDEASEEEPVLAAVDEAAAVQPKEVASRRAVTTYRVRYVDEETGELIKQQNYSVAEETSDDNHTFEVSVDLTVPTGYVAVAAETGGGQELAIVDNAIAAAIVEKDSSSRTLKVLVRQDETSLVSKSEEGYSELRAYIEQDSVVGGSSITEGNQIFYPVTDTVDYLNNYVDGSSYDVFKDAQITAYSNGNGTANLVFGITVKTAQTGSRMSNQTTYQTLTLAMGADHGEVISLHQAYATVNGVSVTPEAVVGGQGSAVRYFTSSGSENLYAYVFSVPKAPATFPEVSFVITMTVPENVPLTWGALSSATQNKEQSGHYVNDGFQTNLAKTSGGQITYINHFIVRGDIANDYDPVGQEQTVHTDERPDAATAIKELDSANKPLPKGTTFSWKEEVDTSTAGDKTGTVLVTYSDYTVDEVPVVVHVIPRNTPPSVSATDATGQLNVSYDLRTTVTVADAEDDADDTDNKETTVTYSITYPNGFVENVAEQIGVDFIPTQTGDYKVTVTVTDSDGEVATTDFTLTVTSQADNYEPIVQDNKVGENEVPQAENSIANKDDLPAGTVIDWQEVPDTSTVGDKPATVIVTYPDGSKDEVPVVVTVQDQVAPEVTIDNVKASAKTVTGETEPQATVVVTFPNGETVETVAAEDGTYKVTIPDTVSLIVGDVISAVATDAAGNSSQPATTTVRPSGGVIIVEDVVRPEGKDQTIGLLETPDPEDSLANRDVLPEGTVVTWKETPDTTKAGEITAVLVATYPNGRTAEEAVTIIVTNEPPVLELYDDATGWLGVPQDLSATVWVSDKEDDASDEDDLVKRFSYEVITPSNKVLTLTEEEGANFIPEETGEYVIIATVTDSQGASTEPIYYILDVTNQALTNDPEPQAVTIDLNEPASVQDAITNLTDLPAGTKIAWKEEPATNNAGTYPASVVVSYPDGSSEEVATTVIVRNDLPVISATDTTGKLNVVQDLTATVTASDKEDDASATDDLVKTVTYELVSPNNRHLYLTEEMAKTFHPNEAGDYKVTAIVTDSQGAIAKVEFTVTVTSQADENDPTAQPVTVDLNGSPAAQDAISNASDLPEGTEIEWKEEPVTNNAGTYPATVVVSYPDGSSEEVETTVTVVNELPTISATDTTGKFNVAQDLTATVTASDKEDDASATDDLVKVVTYEVTSPTNQTVTLTEEEAKSYKPTETGAYTVVATVTDSQGATAKAEFTVTVTSQADENDPTTQAVTVELNDTPAAKDAISNASDLPEGTEIEWKEEPVTNNAGTYPATVVVSYPDGSSEEVATTVTVVNELPTISVTNTTGKFNVAQDLTATVSASDKEDDASATDDLVKVVTYEVTSPANQTVTLTEDEAKSYKPTETGAYTVVATVTDSQGATAKAEFTVTVTSQADENDPTAQAVTVDLNGTPAAQDAISNASDLPEGTEIEWKEEPTTNNAGIYSATVVVSYPDGSSEEVETTVIVVDNRTDAEKYEPTDQSQTVRVNQEPEATNHVTNLSDLPAGTTVAYKEPVDTSTVGSKRAIVVVTYPDNSQDELAVVVNVRGSGVIIVNPETQADLYEPEVTDQTVELNTPVTADQSVTNLDELPVGTTLEFAMPVDTSQVGDVVATVVVTYPDESKEEIEVVVHVVDSRTDADRNEPTAIEQEVAINQPVDAKDFISNLSELPEGTTVSFVDTPSTAEVGTYPVELIVTYPDKSTDTVSSTLTVVDNRTDAEKYEPTGQSQTVRVNQEPAAENHVTNLSDLPAGTTVAYKEAVDTSTVGGKPATIVVTYPDNSQDELAVVVNVRGSGVIIVNPETQADLYEPEVIDQTVELNAPVSAEQSVTNLADLPEGTTLDFATPVDTSQVGDVVATVVVTYPDESKEEIEVVVHVVDSRTDADRNEPTATEQEVNINQPVDAKDFISNLSELPEGTTVSFVDTPSTAEAGTYPVELIVTYPDNSTDTVSSTLTVVDNRTDAEKYEPVGQSQTVRVNQEPAAENHVTNLSDLPVGTTVAYKDAVDTSTVGGKPATIVVTYPDNSQDELAVVVNVRGSGVIIVKPETQADLYEPEVTDQTVELNTPVLADQSVTNLADLPEGTTLDFATPVDTSQVGDVVATVVVTYPDESKEEIEVVVHVVDSRTDADRNEPTSTEQEVAINQPVDAQDFIANLSELPEGTIVSFVDTPSTTEVGTYPVELIVTYPDKSTDTVSSTLTVVDNRTDAEKYEPTGQSQTVRVNQEPAAENHVTNLSDLPAGTTVAYKDAVDTSTVGGKPATIVVTYPDNSQDELAVVVNVRGSGVIIVNPEVQSDLYEPEVTDQTVELNTPVSADQSVTNLADLPEGTTVAFATPVDTSQVGDVVATVVVTYPDESKEEIEVFIKVVAREDDGTSESSTSENSSESGQSSSTDHSASDSTSSEQSESISSEEVIGDSVASEDILSDTSSSEVISSDASTSEVGSSSSIDHSASDSISSEQSEAISSEETSSDSVASDDFLSDASSSEAVSSEASTSEVGSGSSIDQSISESTTSETSESITSEETSSDSVASDDFLSDTSSSEAISSDASISEVGSGSSIDQSASESTTSEMSESITSEEPSSDSVASDDFLSDTSSSEAISSDASISEVGSGSSIDQSASDSISSEQSEAVSSEEPSSDSVASDDVISDASSSEAVSSDASTSEVGSGSSIDQSASESTTSEMSESISSEETSSDSESSDDFLSDTSSSEAVSSDASTSEVGSGSSIDQSASESTTSEMSESISSEETSSDSESSDDFLSDTSSSEAVSSDVSTSEVVPDSSTDQSMSESTTSEMSESISSEETSSDSESSDDFLSDTSSSEAISSDASTSEVGSGSSIDQSASESTTSEMSESISSEEPFSDSESSDDFLSDTSSSEAISSDASISEVGSGTSTDQSVSDSTSSEQSESISSEEVIGDSVASEAATSDASSSEAVSSDVSTSDVGSDSSTDPTSSETVSPELDSSESVSGGATIADSEAATNPVDDSGTAVKGGGQATASDLLGQTDLNATDELSAQELNHLVAGAAIGKEIVNLSTSSAKATASDGQAKHQTTTQLPETGDQRDSALTVLGLTGLLGAAALTYRKKEEN